MATKKAVDWARYNRCPVCFRSWDCRSLRRTGRRYAIGYWSEDLIGKVWRQRTYYGLPIGWGDRELKRPHAGRKRRAA